MMGLLHNEIDTPYLQKVTSSFATGCKWCQYCYSKMEMASAENAVVSFGLNDY